MSQEPETDAAPPGHPRGLSPLFFTEMWERFSFYGMRAIFVPFMQAALVAGGLAFTKEQAGAVLALYMSMVYMMALPGGWIADKYLGQRRAVFIGGFIIMLGHIFLAIPMEIAFYVGLACLVIGTGFLKPNVSTMVGQLYAKKDPRRDGGFSIFYMGINVGAFVSPIVCGFLAQSETFKTQLVAWGIDPHWSWHFGFGAAAVGMGLGLILFRIGTRTLTGVGDPPRITDPVERARNKKVLLGITGALIAGPTILYFINASGAYALTKERIANIFGVVLILLFSGTFFLLYRKAQGKERKGVLAMLTLAIGCIAFFALFEQAAGTMNSFALERTDNVAFGKPFPSAWYQSINPVFIILLSPLFAWFFTWVVAKKLAFNDIKKFGVSLLVMGSAFVIMLPATKQTGLVSPLYLVAFYFLSTVAELFLSPVGLSSMSKLAPTSAGGLVMGVWFLSTANGDYIAGRVHGLTGEVPLHKLCMVLALSVFAVAALMFVAGSYFTRKVPLESLVQSGREDGDEGAAEVKHTTTNSISGYAIAGFATGVSIWPLVLNDPKLGFIVCLIMSPAALFLVYKGWLEARKYNIGGVVYAALGAPIAAGALLYSMISHFG